MRGFRVQQVKSKIMKKFSIDEFICNLQELVPENAIYEVMTAGLSNDEVIDCFKAITFNSTFKFKKSWQSFKLKREQETRHRTSSLPAH